MHTRRLPAVVVRPLLLAAGLGLVVLAAACSGADPSIAIGDAPAQEADAPPGPAVDGSAPASAADAGPVSCTSTCAEGAVQCSATAAGTIRCTRQPSGCSDWAATTPCTAGQLCSGGACVAQCTNQCTLGAKTCNGTGLATCELKPSGCTDWSVPAPCSSGQVCAGGVCQATGPATWKTVVTPTNQALRKVWGSNASDVFAVGDGGTILHWDGAAWSAMASGTVSHLRGVWGTSATNVYAVGGTGGAPTVVLRYDGATWSKVTAPAFSAAASIEDVFGTGPNDVWVLGSTPNNGASKEAALRWDGNAWTRVLGANLAGGSNFGYSGAPGDVWLVDYNGVGAHLANGTWTTFPLAVSGGITTPLSLSGSGKDNVFFANTKNRLTRWNGQTVATLTSPDQDVKFNGIFIRSTNEGLVVANMGRILVWNGIAWSIDTRAQNIGTPTLLGVWASGPSDAWAVGENGAILHLGP